MTGPGQSGDMDPVAGARFFEANLKRGINPMERGVTLYDSTTGLFRHLVDLPPDMHVDTVTFQARKPI
jgi:hypothetical protein